MSKTCIRRISVLLVSLTAVAGLSFALQSSSAEADGEACVDNGEESVGHWKLYISTMADHLVKDVDVKADGNGIVVQSVTYIGKTFDYMSYATITLGDEDAYEIRYSVTNVGTRLWFCFHDQIGFWAPIRMDNWHSNSDGNSNSNSDNSNGGGSSDSNSDNGDDTGNDDTGNDDTGNDDTGNDDTGNDGDYTGNNGDYTGNNGGGNSQSDSGQTSSLSSKSDQSSNKGASSSDPASSQQQSVQAKSIPTAKSTRSQSTDSVWTVSIVIPTPEPVPTPKPPHTGDGDWTGMMLVAGALLLICGLVVFNLRFAPTQAWASRQGNRPMQFLSW